MKQVKKRDPGFELDLKYKELVIMVLSKFSPEELNQEMIDKMLTLKKEEIK